MIKSLGVKRQSKPVMPDDFYQITPTPPEDEKIARMRVAPETFLDLQRQSVHAAAHVLQNISADMWSLRLCGARHWKPA